MESSRSTDSTPSAPISPATSSASAIPALTFEHAIDQEMAQRLAAAAESADLPLSRKPAIWELVRPLGRSSQSPCSETPCHRPSASSASASDHPPTTTGWARPSARRSHPSTSRPPLSPPATPSTASTRTRPEAVIPLAKEVQRTYETALTNWDHEALIAIDESLRRDVDESVVSPTLILMGAMQELGAHPRILCSEHPWGVGYVTALVDTTPEHH